MKIQIIGISFLMLFTMPAYSYEIGADQPNGINIIGWGAVERYALRAFSGCDADDDCGLIVRHSNCACSEYKETINKRYIDAYNTLENYEPQMDCDQMCSEYEKDDRIIKCVDFGKDTDYSHLNPKKVCKLFPAK